MIQIGRAAGLDYAPGSMVVAAPAEGRPMMTVETRPMKQSSEQMVREDLFAMWSAAGAMLASHGKNISPEMRRALEAVRAATAPFVGKAPRGSAARSSNNWSPPGRAERPTANIAAAAAAAGQQTRVQQAAAQHFAGQQAAAQQTAAHAATQHSRAVQQIHQAHHNLARHQAQTFTPGTYAHQRRFGK